MSRPLEQHQVEIERNLRAWQNKSLLRAVYRRFYERVVALINPNVPGRIVEIGSGIGNLKSLLPAALATDLFPNPWLDLVCDGYELPFIHGSVSHLILFDVFHHLQAPDAFLRQARRVLNWNGRIIIIDPYISWCSYPVYALLHHEHVGWKKTIQFSESAPPRPRDYYAAQGNATRLFFRKEKSGWPEGWQVFHAEAFACFSYLLTGGFSKPAMYPTTLSEMLIRLDSLLSRWPRLFAGRCLVGLTVECAELRSDLSKGVSHPGASRRDGLRSE
jgi:SAM-dependent methyltransferase